MVHIRDSFLLAFLVLFLLFSCNNTDNDSQVNRKNHKILYINTSIINFECIYSSQNKIIKDPLPFDTIFLKLKFKPDFKSIALANKIDLVPSSDGCKIEKLGPIDYKIYFKENFSDSILVWTLYLTSVKYNVFDKNRKRLHKSNETIFIAEKLNRLDR